MLTQNQRNFINAHTQLVATVSREEVINYLTNPESDNTCDGGARISIEDHWYMWETARFDLTNDLVAAIEQLLEYSENTWVKGSQHDFLIPEKLKELNYKWGLVPIKEK